MAQLFIFDLVNTDGLSMVIAKVDKLIDLEYPLENMALAGLAEETGWLGYGKVYFDKRRKRVFEDL